MRTIILKTWDFRWCQLYHHTCGIGGCSHDNYGCYQWSLCWQHALLWRHNGCNGISNHQPRYCLLNRSFRCTSKKTSKLRVTGLCAGNSPVIGVFPAQMACNSENVPIWWRHQGQLSVFIEYDNEMLFTHLLLQSPTWNCPQLNAIGPHW